MSAMTAVGEFFGVSSRETYLERQLVERQEESYRLANDPVALADLSAQAIRRPTNLVIADLEQAKARVREHAEAFCRDADRVIDSFQRQADPVIESINNYAAEIASACELLAKFRV